MTWLGQLFNIRPGEGRTSSLMLLHAFFMGIATVFFETAASALFLTSYDKGAIPVAYIGAAIVSTLTGVVYSRLRDRLTFWGLMGATLLFLFVTVLGFRIGLTFSEAAWVAFGLFVWYRVLSILTDLEYWAVASRIYDVRQGKRLFSFIGSGEVVARIVGSFSIPLVVGVVGVPNLIFVSAVGLLLCLLVVIVLQRNAREGDDENASGASSTEPTAGFAQIREMFGKPYVALIFALAIAGVFGKYFVDFAFLQQMQTRYRDAANLAGFFGIFSGVTQIVNLLMRVFVSGRVLSRWGIRAGLLILPLAHLACTIAIVVTGLMGGSGELLLVFWLAIANQGIYKVFKHPFDNPSLKVLYQPLSKAERLTTQIVNEVIVSPITIGVAGGIMLLFSTVVEFDPVVFAWVMVATFVAWIAVAVRAFREYGSALVAAIRRRVLDDVVFEVGDETSLAVVRERLSSPNTGDVIFALTLLEKSGSRELETALRAAAEHTSPDVRRHVFETAGRARLRGFLNRLEDGAFSGGESPRVREAAIESLALVGDADRRERIAGLLESSSLAYRRAALRGLLASGDPYFADRARETLWRDSKSSDPARRKVAAEVVGRAGGPRENEIVFALLDDQDPVVCRAAVESSVGRKDDALLDAVCARLDDARLAGAAMRVLVAAGDAGVSVLSRYLRDPRMDRVARIRAVRVLGKIGTREAALTLRARIDDDDEPTRSRVLAELAAMKHRVDPEEIDVIETRMRAEARGAAWRLGVVDDLAGSEDLALLRRAVLSEIEQAKRRLFDLAALAGHSDVVRRARDIYFGESRERRAYAVEILDLRLDERLKRWLLPFVEDLPARARRERFRREFALESRPAAERVVELATGAAELASDWTRIAALDVVGRKLMTSALPRLRTLRERVSDPAVRDAIDRALRKLGDATYTSTGETAQVMYSTVERVIILKSVPVFAAASEQLLAEVASVLEEVEFEAGDVVFEKGDPGTSMFIIVHGRVRVHDGDRTIVHLGERDVFGELAALDPEPRSASITAAEATQLFRLDREPLYEVMADHVEIASGIFHVLCQRLRAVTSGVRTDDVGPPPAPAGEPPGQGPEQNAR
jgi:HEAT repeat protein